MNDRDQKTPTEIGKLVALLNPSQQIDLRQYWATLWRRKWWVIVPCFAITCGSVAYALLFIHPVYESSATIQILPSRLQRSVQAVTSGVSNAVDFNELQKTILSTNNLNLLSQRLELGKNERAAKAAKELHATTPWLSYDELLQRILLQHLRENISVNMNYGAQIFQITAHHETPQLAYQMTKTLAEVFIDESKKNELRGIRGVMEFSDEQMAAYQAKVKESEEKLRHFRELQASRQVKQIGLGAESFQAIREFINASEAAIADRLRLLEQLKAKLPGKASALQWSSIPELARIQTRIEERLSAFQRTVRASGLQKEYELSLNNDINSLRQECQRTLPGLAQRLFPTGDQSTPGVMQQYLLTQIDLYILQTRNTLLNGILNEFMSQATMSSGDQIELNRLENELAQNRRVYNIFFEQSRGSQIEEALQNSDADFKYRLVEPATLPVFAVSGSKRKFVSIAFLLSLGCGVALVFGIEFLDQTIRTVEEVEEFLHIPTWGIIPKIDRPFRIWHASLQASDGRDGNDQTRAHRHSRHRKQSDL